MHLCHSHVCNYIYTLYSFSNACTVKNLNQNLQSDNLPFHGDLLPHQNMKETKGERDSGDSIKTGNVKFEGLVLDTDENIYRFYNSHSL